MMRIFNESSDNDLNNLKFFDEKQIDNQTSSGTYDDGRVPSAPNDDVNDQTCTRISDSSDDSDADFVTFMGDNPSSEGNDPSSSNMNTQSDLPKSNRAIDRYKSRLADKGFSQRDGFYYLETFSPVVKMSTVRCMLNVAICNNWNLFQLDIMALAMEALVDAIDIDSG
ncbi:ribonuclease H-like domain-containing protein [Tanacetum coccineum]